jgi:hypothetical protein
MCDVPAAWQSRLGATHLTGLSCVPVVQRTSWGCIAAFGFNPAHLVQGQTAPVIPFCYYNQDHQTFDEGDDNTQHHNTWNWTAWMGGSVFPAGTDTVLYFGRIGIGPFYYNGGSNAEPYRYRVWAYNANDFEAVKNGTKQPWEVVPYALWNLSTPFQPGDDWWNGTFIGGVAYDAATKRIYVSCLKENDGGTTPIIHVYTHP